MYAIRLMHTEYGHRAAALWWAPETQQYSFLDQYCPVFATRDVDNCELEVSSVLRDGEFIRCR